MEKYKIFCWWLNDTEMSDNRKSSLEQLRKVSSCEIIFIDKNNLKDYILPSFQLHEGFKYLSEIQKGDYLKCYFMHHYGGGYTDIKKTLGSWVPFFDELYKNEEIYVVGYREADVGHIANLDHCSLNPQDSKYCRDFSITEDGTKWTSAYIKEKWYELVGNGAFICRKQTPFTFDWWNGLNEKMDGYLNQLKENPAKWPRDANGHDYPYGGGPSKYPIKWAVINGNIFHPLCLKYTKNVLKNLHYPDCSNYM